MSVYHCPLCPLIFNYRTEVEWHLREEHRSRSDEEADLRAELSSATEPLDWGRLRELRSSKGSPSVSLLISTAPAAAMTVLDIARLRQLADRARRRLPAEPGRDTPTSVVEHRLSHAVALAETLPTDRGIAVLVNPHHIAIHTLPFAPRDRHVVDAGFATRDLEYALRRHPRYRVLVLGHHPRILEGHGSQLASADDQPNTARPSTVDRSAAGPVSGCSCAELDALLDRRVEQAGPLPLVIVGERRHLEDFPRHSCHAGQVIAQVVRPPLRRASPADLAVQAVERWLAEQQQQSVAELHDAARADRVVWGSRRPGVRCTAGAPTGCGPSTTSPSPAAPFLGSTGWRPPPTPPSRESQTTWLMPSSPKPIVSAFPSPSSTEASWRTPNQSQPASGPPQFRPPRPLPPRWRSPDLRPTRPPLMDPEGANAVESFYAYRPQSRSGPPPAPGPAPPIQPRSWRKHQWTIYGLPLLNYPNSRVTSCIPAMTATTRPEPCSTA